MNKSAIQKFAMWARTTLIEQVAQRAYQYGITKDGYGEENAVTVNGMALSSQEQSQRRELVREIQAKGYDQVVEEVAYTWFNRFIALRYMEVNNYLPSHIRVFSNAQGAFDPEILKEAHHIDLPGLDQSKVAEYIEKTETEALYRYLLLTQCNALNEALPKMFEKMGGYTELLFPNNILRPDSVLGRMVADIPEEDWTDQVQIIGWLYQYYNTELKAETFDLLNKNVKVTKERIPSATQLFTPDWIVRYMVENSLGRLWLDHLRGDSLLFHPVPDDAPYPSMDDWIAPTDKLKANWHYYVDEAEQTEEVEHILEEYKVSLSDLSPENIRFIDPCMGSGHILVYAFDVLMQIYENAGWSQRDAAQSIIQHNLYGLDIDDRAAQLAYFSVMMKARQYDRRLFSRGLQPKVFSIQESNRINRYHLRYFGQDLKEPERNLALEQMEELLDVFENAKEFGSLLTIQNYNWENLYRFVLSCDYGQQLELEAVGLEDTKDRLFELVYLAAAMAQSYHVVVTNPPYMAVSNGDAALNKYIKDNYPDSKGDLFAAFIERCGRFTRQNGYQAMITQHSWMFLSSFEKLRTKLLQSADIVNMAHLGARAFEEIGGEVVQTTSFVLCRAYTKGYKGTYCRLVEPTTQQGKEDMFLTGENRYTAEQTNFSKIPASPVAYWASDSLLCAFDDGVLLGKIATPKQGIATTDNNRFVRSWTEVKLDQIGFGISTLLEAEQSNIKWFPLNKGGEFNRWYGNRIYVVNYQNDGKEIKENVLRKYPYLKTPDFVVKNSSYYFKECISWSKISMSKVCFRFFEPGFIFSDAGMALFVSEEKILTIFGLLNSKVAFCILQTIAPTTNFESGHIERIPVLQKIFDNFEIQINVKKTIQLSREDWDAYETSWDFKRHPLV